MARASRGGWAPRERRSEAGAGAPTVRPCSARGGANESGDGRRRGALRPRRGSGVACFVDSDCCSLIVLEGPVADSMLRVKCPLCGRIFRARLPLRILQKVQGHLGMDHDDVSITERLRAFRAVAAVFDKRVV